MNILTIFNRESMLNVKRRKLLLSLSIAITLFAIITLIVINNIVVEADIYSYVNYNYVRMMIRFAMFFEIGLVFILAFVCLANSINTDKKNLSLQNIICSGISKRDIVLGKYINGVLNTSCIAFAGMPVAYISLFFGGYTVSRIIKYMVILMILILLANAIALFISAKIRDVLVSLLVSISVLFVLYILLFITIDYIMLNRMNTLCFSFLSLLLSFVLLRFTVRSKIFLL